MRIEAYLIRYSGKEKLKDENGTEVNNDEHGKWSVIEDENYKNKKRPELFELDEPKRIYESNTYGWRVYTHFYNSIEGCDEKWSACVAFRVSDAVSDPKVYIKLPNEGQSGAQSTVLFLPELDQTKLIDNEPVSSLNVGGCEEKWFRMPFEDEKVSINTGKTSKEHNYVTAVGAVDICFESENERLEYRLYTDPSPGIEKDKYDEMIDDLVGIYENAVYIRSSNQTMGKRYLTSEEQLKSQLNRIGDLLQRISDNPESMLAKTQVKMPFHKIRSFSNRTLPDYYSGNINRMRSNSYEENYDIYEHRIIRAWIKKTKRYADSQLERIERKADLSGLSEPQVEEEGFIDYENAFEAKYNEFKTNHNIQGQTQGDETENLTAQVERGPNGLVLGENYLRPQDDKKYISNLKYCCVDTVNDESNEYNYKTKFNINISVDTNSFIDKLYLYYLIDEINRSDNEKVIKLIGNGTAIAVPKNNTDYNSYVRICFNRIFRAECLTGANAREYNAFGSSFAEFEERLENEIDFRARLKELYVLANTKDSELIAYGFLKQKREDAAKAGEKKNALKNITDICPKLISAYRFLNTRDTMEMLHPTNLFLQGRYYKDIFSIMREIPDQFYCLDSYGEIRTRVRAAQNVFEMWGLYAMLDHFRSIGFFFEDRQNAYEYLLNYFRTGKNENVLFKLRKETGNGTINVEILYQFKIISNKVKDSKGKFVGYTPDFIWKISRNDEPPKFMIIDTKYKDFKNQGIWAWAEEMLQVAFYKYQWVINGGNLDGTGTILSCENLLGAYIMHPDYNRNTENINAGNNEEDIDTRGYYGQDIKKFLLYELYKGIDNAYTYHIPMERHMPYSDQDKDLLFCIREILLDTTKDEQAKKDEIEALFNNGDYKSFFDYGRIGSIAVRPGNYEYLMNLFRMIMEHFYGIDSRICWRCGSDDIVELPKPGVGSFYKCNKCNERWVVTVCQSCTKPIRKHWMNYYSKTRETDKINIICPNCSGKFTAINHP